ncbi:MAG: hypothetical protein K5893_11960 [Prevotella sp.]|nr:hypothetical protein [Prevotella sp.]
MKKLTIVLLAVLALVACSTEKKAEKKSLVVYYSITSTTKAAAECIQQMTGADIAALQAKDAYPTDFQKIIERSMQEMKDSVMPEMLPLEADIAAYDTIFVGYPIWFGTYALPMKSWLASADLKGKVIVPFATFGSGGYTQSMADMKAALPESQVVEGFGIRAALKDMIPACVEEMLIKLGMKEGEVEQKADFSEQKAVGKEETEIFDTAVKGYDMLKAKAKTVGSRTVKAGTEYRFEAENEGQDGSKKPVTVFVMKENGDKAPYFTLVEY